MIHRWLSREGWDVAFGVAPVADHLPGWLTLDAGPVVGLVVGTNGWGPERDLSVEIAERCRGAVLDTSQDPLQAAMEAIPGAVADYRQGRRPDSSMNYAAGATLMCLGHGSIQYASIGAGSLFLADRDGVRLVVPGQELMYELVKDGRLTLGEVFEHPHRLIWTNVLWADEPHNNWDVGSCSVEPGAFLVTPSQELGWELQRKSVEGRLPGRTAKGAADLLMTAAAAQPDPPRGPSIVVARLVD